MPAPRGKRFGEFLLEPSRLCFLLRVSPPQKGADHQLGQGLVPNLNAGHGLPNFLSALDLNRTGFGLLENLGRNHASMAGENKAHDAGDRGVRRDGWPEQFHCENDRRDGNIGCPRENTDQPQRGKHSQIESKYFCKKGTACRADEAEGEHDATASAEIESEARGKNFEQKGIPDHRASLKGLLNTIESQAKVLV